MKKNVAGQKIGAQIVNASTGAAFTGAVVVYVTGDAGTQAVGSVGSGACTHEGKGFHTYAPAQAETNYDHVAFSFEGTGAVPATVQVYTAFPQTGDVFPLVDTEIAAILAAIAALNNISPAQVLAEVASALATYDAPTFAELDARTDSIEATLALIKAVTDVLPNAGALTSLATQASVNTIDDFLDTEMAATLAAVLAIKAVTDLLPNAGALTSLVPPTATENADAVLKRDMSAVTGEAARSLLQAIRFLRNRWSLVSIPGSLAVYKEDDTTLAWQAPVTVDPTADPVTSVDPT